MSLEKQFSFKLLSLETLKCTTYNILSEYKLLNNVTNGKTLDLTIKEFEEVITQTDGARYQGKKALGANKFNQIKVKNHKQILRIYGHT